MILGGAALFKTRSRRVGTKLGPRKRGRTEQVGKRHPLPTVCSAFVRPLSAARSSACRHIDIFATRATATGGTDVFAIQCKRYTPRVKVGEPEARALLGVLAKDRTFTKGIIVTTSDFTAECRRFVEGQGNLELINGERLVRLLKQSGFPLD